MAGGLPRPPPRLRRTSRSAQPLPRLPPPAGATYPRTGTATTPRATRTSPWSPRNGPAGWCLAARAPTGHAEHRLRRQIGRRAATGGSGRGGAAAGGSDRQRCPSFYRPLLHRSTMSALWYVAAAHSAHPPNQVLAPDRAVGRSVCPVSVVFSQRRHHLCFVGVQMRRHPWAVLRRASPFPLFLSTRVCAALPTDSAGPRGAIKDLSCSSLAVAFGIILGSKV